MRATSVAALCFSLAAHTVAARDITLSSPIDCDLSGDCYVQQYVDHDASDGAMDFRCSNLSYDTHKGTDFALRSLKQMQRGVDVLSAAPGTIRATRDGMPDALFTPDRIDDIDGRDCGNGLVIDHEDGWTTQYCHMKRGSIAVSEGDTVSRSTVLGQVGLSGRTQFPHLHMTVRRGDEVIDPFDPDGDISCNVPSDDTLWDTTPPYRPGGVLTVGFADAVPEFDAIKAGQAATATLPPDSPAIVVFGFVFGSQSGDRMQLGITGPNGTLIDQTLVLERGQAQLFRAIGKRRTTPAWPTGTYEGTATLIRDGKTVSTERGTVVVE